MTNVTEMLLKLRKGSCGFLNAKKAEMVLNELQGWSIEKGVFYRRSTAERAFVKHFGFGDRNGSGPSAWSGKFKKSPESIALVAYSYENVNLEDYRTQLDDAYVYELPSPTMKKAPKAVIMNLSLRDDADSRNQAFFFDLYIRVQGHTITSPDGQVYIVTTANDIGYDSDDQTTFDQWFRWASEYTSLMDDINGVLGMEAHVKASDRPRKAKEGQVLGTCAICGKIHVVHGTKMVSHGYQRPGYGYQTADCFGAGYDAYEVSSEACSAYIPQLERFLSVAQDRVEELKRNPEGQSFTVTNWRKETETISFGDTRYGNQYDIELFKAEREVKFIEEDIDVMQSRIDNWKQGDLQKG